MRKILISLAILSLSGGSTKQAIACGCSNQNQEFESSYQLSFTFRAVEPKPYDYYGSAVVIEDGVVAIKRDSGYRDGDGFSSTVIFEQVGDDFWRPIERFDFDAGGNEGNPFFGQELAIDGGEIVVGYSHTYTDALLRPLQFISKGQNGWERTISGYHFPTFPLRARGGNRLAGRSVDISGDWAIAEETNAMRRDGGMGVARVYHKSPEGQWLEVANLFPQSGRDISITTVAINGATAALVDRTSDDGGLYFFERQSDGQWVETQNFPQDPATSRGFFSRVVEIDGDTAVTRDERSGIVSIFERESGVWELVHEVDATTPEYVITGGVALEGDRIAYTEGVSDGGRDPYRVKLLRRQQDGTWAYDGTISHPDPTRRQIFGADLDFDQGRLLISGAAARDWRSYVPPGAAYLFTPIPEPSAFVLLFLACIGFHRARLPSRVT